jgi:hypothetical protein
MPTDATPTQIAEMIRTSVEAATARSEADQRLAVERLRTTAAAAPAYTMGGVRYPASALLDCAAQIEALYTPATPEPVTITSQAEWQASLAQYPTLTEEELDADDREAMAITARLQHGVWDGALQPVTYTGRTRTLEYTRERDAADYRLCQPGDVAQRLVHQREYQQGEGTGWETTREEDIA